MSRRGLAKTFARHDRDVVFLEQGIGKVLARHAGAANIQHHVHCALGRHEADGVLPCQNILSQQPATLEGSRDFGLERGALVQREQGGVLNVSRHAIGRVGRKIGQMFNRVDRPNDPATTGTGHSVAFRHRPHDQRVICHTVQRARRQMFAFPNLRVIHLVRDQPHVVMPADLRDAFKRLAGIDDAGGVIGGIDQQRCCSGLLGCGGYRVGSGLKCIIGTGEHGMGQGADTADRAGVGGIVRIDIKRGIAGVAGRHMRRKQRTLPTGCDQHVIARCGDTGAFLQPRGHGIAQVGGAGNGSIARVTGQRCTVHILQDRRGSTDVMFTNGKFGYIGTICDHLARAQENAPTV